MAGIAQRGGRKRGSDEGIANVGMLPPMGDEGGGGAYGYAGTWNVKPANMEPKDLGRLLGNSGWARCRQKKWANAALEGLGSLETSYYRYRYAPELVVQDVLFTGVIPRTFNR